MFRPEKKTPVLLTVTVPAILATLGEIKLVAEATDVKSRELTPISPNSENFLTRKSFLRLGQVDLPLLIDFKSYGARRSIGLGKAKYRN